MFLGLDRGKQKGSSSHAEAYEDVVFEAAYNEEKFEICRKALVKLRDKHQAAAQICNIALDKVKDVPVTEDLGAAAPTVRHVIDVSDDRRSFNEVPHTAVRNKRTPYTRSRAARDSKKAASMKAKIDG